MNGVLEILTVKVIAELAWKAIKTGAEVTTEVFREPLKKWLLADSELEAISQSINQAPDSDKRTEKYIEAFLDDNPVVQNLIKNANTRSAAQQMHSGLGDNVIGGKTIQQNHNGSGDNVAGNKIVGR